MMKRLVLLSILGASLTVAAPAQTLRDLEGKLHSVPELTAQKGTEALVLMVWCSQCGSCRGAERDVAAFAKQEADKVRLYLVDAHPADTPEKIKRFLVGQGLKLDVLRDTNQALISSLKIDRTTTTMVYDKKGKLRYFGPFQGDGKGFAEDAVADILAGREVGMKSRPLKGCPIPRLK